MNAKTLISTALTTGLLTTTACDDTQDEADLRIVMITPATNDLVTAELPPIDDIRITFHEIQLHHVDEGWIAVDPADEDAELYFGEMPLAIANAMLPEGEYDQLRLVVDEAEIYVGNEAQPLEIPSGQSSGLKIHGELCVAHDDDPEDEPAEHELVLRWDVDEGIRYSDERGYWLVPSVHIDDAPACPSDQ
ncbi:MAG: DUF4382 domain-containing protein [Myxococcales bacterium]|nr:DUF4382 domain-containing protein [Myxococcales bacterium]